MQTSETLKRKITTAQDLLSVVKTMKALAAASIRQYERAVESLADYFLTVELGLRVIVKNEPRVLASLMPPVEGRLLAVVFGSDYGMTGQFNDQVAQHAMQKISESPEGKEEWIVWAVGVRLLGSLEIAGYSIAEIFSIPNSVAAIIPTVQRILLAIEEWQSGGKTKRIVLFYNKPGAGGSFQPQDLQLFPIDRDWLQAFSQKGWPTRVLPTFTMDPVRLLSALIGQFLFVSLSRALAESLASENASRLASMQAAEKNISERLDELNMQYHHQRQSTITEELMDIVSGVEALKKTDKS